MKTLFVNACVRPESRTLKLAQHVLEKLGNEYTEVNLEKENIQPASENTKSRHQLDADDAAFLSAVGTGLILHELHERNKEQERASRDYDGNWDNPDDDSQYDDNQYDDWE